MPFLHSPSVSLSVPSMSRVARLKNSFGCLAHTFRRMSLTMSMKVKQSAAVKRRQ